jgi:protein SCO1
MSETNAEARAIDAVGAAARYFPNVHLRTQDNRPVRFYDDLLKGRIVMINFFYTTCTGSCNMTTHNLVKIVDGIGDHIGRDVLMLSLTVDPAHDTPKVLKQYAELYDARRGWYFLTGSRRDLDLIRDRLGARDRLNREGPHTAVLVYGNADTGQWATAPAQGDPQLIVSSVMRLVDLAARQSAARSIGLT